MHKTPFDFSLKTTDPSTRQFSESLLDALGRTGFLQRSFVTPIIGSQHTGFGVNNHVRSTTTTFESWYVAGQANGTAMTTANPAVNTLIAVPFVADTTFPVDRLAFEVTTVSGANGKARVGIYSAKVGTDGAFYPGLLLVQSAEADVSSGTGSESTTVSFRPTLGALYFAAYLCGTANPTIRTVPVGGLYPAMGLPAALGAAPQLAYTVSSTYASAGLPTTFPSGATAHTSAVPAISLRFSAPQDYERTYPARHFVEEGFSLQRAFVISSEDVSLTRSGPYFVIEARLREGESVTTLGTYDSRSNSLKPGTPFYLTGEQDVDTDLDAGATLEVYVLQTGQPSIDLSHLRIQWDCPYVGGSNA
jgi:hypothetical protein